jgi:DNA-binding NtrC family response regulator
MAPLKPRSRRRASARSTTLEKPIALQRLLATVKRALRNNLAAPSRELSLAHARALAGVAETRKRLAQLAQAAAR